MTPDPPGFWAALYAYLVAFFFAWWWIVGVLFAIERFVERRSDGWRVTMDRIVSHEIRGRLIAGGTALAIFLSGFVAWRDTETQKAHADYEQARAALVAANTEIASLKARTAARQLTAQQQQQIVSTLQRWRGAVFVRLVTIDGSSEIADYRASFADLFGSLAWPIQLELVSTSNIPAPLGLAVATRPGSAGAWLFATALREAGVPFDTFSPSQWPTEVPEIGLIVFVARRPD